MTINRSISKIANDVVGMKADHLKDAYLRELHCQHIKAAGQRPGSIGQRRGAIRRLGDYLDPYNQDPRAVVDATLDQLAEWQASMSERAPAYISSQVAHLRQFYGWLVNPMGIRRDNPGQALLSPIVRKRLPRPIPEHDCARKATAEPGPATAEPAGKPTAPASTPPATEPRPAPTAVASTTTTPRGRHRRAGQHPRGLLLACAVPLIALPSTAGWVGWVVDGLLVLGGLAAALIRKGTLVKKIGLLVLLALLVLAGPALTPMPATANQATTLGAAGSAAGVDRIYRLPDNIEATRSACYRTEREQRGIPGDRDAYIAWWNAHAGTPARADWDAAWHRCNDRHQLPGGKWDWAHMIYVGDGLIG